MNFFCLYQPSIYRIICFICCLFLFKICLGQTYQHKYEPTHITIKNQSFKGYVSNFDLPKATIKKILWKYFKQFSHVHNEHSHYSLVIPNTENEGNVDIFLYMTIIGKDKDLNVSISLDNIGLSEDMKEKYNSQLKQIFIDFKKSLYIHIYKEKEDGFVKKATRLSRKYRKMTMIPAQDSSTILEQLKIIQEKIELIRKEILKISRY